MKGTGARRDPVSDPHENYKLINPNLVHLYSGSNSWFAGNVEDGDVVVA